MNKDKQTHKITNEQYLDAFRKAGGNYTLTAKYIEQAYGISYTRRSAFERAKNFPQEVNMVWLMRQDHSDAALLTYADDESNDIRLRVRIHLNQVNRATRYMLNYKPNAAALQQAQERPKGVFDINGQIVDF